MSDYILADIMSDYNHDAGTKARNDTVAILKKNGFEERIFFNRSHCNLIRLVEMHRCLLGIRKSVRSESIIVVQYPYKKMTMNSIYRSLLRDRKGRRIHIVLLIHDVLYLRGEGKRLDETKANEIRIFNKADALIVHNKIMKHELIKAGVTVPMIVLGLFDYLYKGKLAFQAKKENNVIVFAGNLKKEKSGFLYNKEFFENSDVKLSLYGSKPDMAGPQYIYNGSFDPDELIEHINGTYGLVWDGNSGYDCTGNYGCYLRYNNPHKTSLYIAAGLPIVVWSKSALAELVKEKGLGVCIDSLRELSALPCPSSDLYITMKENVDMLGKQIREGEMLSAAIEKAKRLFV